MDTDETERWVTSSTFDGDPPCACLDDVKEALWSNSYSHYLNHCKSRPHDPFVPLGVEDIDGLRMELRSIQSVQKREEDVPSRVLAIEIEDLRYDLYEMCPHLIFEAEYLEDDSTYDCLTCGLSFLEIEDFHSMSQRV